MAEDVLDLQKLVANPAAWNSPQWFEHAAQLRRLQPTPPPHRSGKRRPSR